MVDSRIFPKWRDTLIIPRVTPRAQTGAISLGRGHAALWTAIGVIDDVEAQEPSPPDTTGATSTETPPTSTKQDDYISTKILADEHASVPLVEVRASAPGNGYMVPACVLQR